MDDKANKILVDLLQKASDGIDSAVAFSQAQIPDVVHQLLIWNAVSSAIFQVAAVVICVAYLLFLPKIIATCRMCDDGEFPALILLFGGGIVAMVMFVGFWFNFDWLKIWLAPKLYLLEYAASLIK